VWPPVVASKAGVLPRFSLRSGMSMVELHDGSSNDAMTLSIHFVVIGILSRGAQSVRAQNAASLDAPRRRRDVNVLAVTSMYPSEEAPAYGTHVHEQIESLRALGSQSTS
jgi:hypothetical protein